jgi:diaminopimelate epimerase
MRLPFVKMHGAGNDFVMVAQSDLGTTVLARATIATLCDRRTGIGGDGLIVIGPAADDDGVEFVMTYYNRDGGEAELCGNGARCAVAFARYLGLAGRRCRFRTAAGVVGGEIRADGVEVTLPGWSDLEHDVTVPGSPFAEHHACNTGVPHLVIPVADVRQVDVAAAGPPLRGHELFAPAGTNVDWIGPAEDGAEPGAWRLRTFERGVEAETRACGTGAAAAAIVLVTTGRAASPVTLITRGEDRLIVSVDPPENALRLRGPAVTAFVGETRVDEN